MITKNFKPGYDSFFRFDYHSDDEVWKGNKPLRTHKSWHGIHVLEEDKKTFKDLIRYEFSFGVCILYEGNFTKELRILNAEIKLCDGWEIFICEPLYSNEYYISISRLTHKTCIKYEMIENRITVYKAINSYLAKWEKLNDEQKEMIERMINIEVEDCYIWEIISNILKTEYYKRNETVLHDW